MSRPARTCVRSRGCYCEIPWMAHSPPEASSAEDRAGLQDRP
ncbi:hypothetical protein L083_5810 [Actinoplanes sp. N902-109]|nr:hypothetical protein L083_5810 [Actinoplanes sp. N902-109]